NTNTFTITDNDNLKVEFTQTAISDAEANGANQPTLTVSGGISTSALTVELADLGIGTATHGAGNDYTFASPQTITIPAANYTAATTINITGLTIINDSIVEPNEIINFLLQNPSTGLTIADADGNSIIESNNTYTITNDDKLNVEFTNA